MPGAARTGPRSPSCDQRLGQGQPGAYGRRRGRRRRPAMRRAARLRRRRRELTTATGAYAGHQRERRRDRDRPADPDDEHERADPSRRAAGERGRAEPRQPASPAGDAGCRIRRAPAGSQPGSGTASDQPTSSRPSPRHQTDQCAHQLPSDRSVAQQRGEVVAGSAKRSACGGNPFVAHQLPVARERTARDLDDVALDASGHRDDLAHPPPPVRARRSVHHDVDATTRPSGRRRRS